MTIKTDPAVVEYLARTKAALAGLPAAEVEEIIDDIGPHLSEIAAELDEVSIETLSARLGAPEEYAAELRTAAGYPSGEPEPEPGRPATLLPRLTLWGLVGGVLAAFGFGLGGPFGRFPPELLVVFGLPALLGLALLVSGAVRIDELADLSEAEAARRSGRRFVESLPVWLVDFVRSLRPAWVVVRTLALAAGFLLGVQRSPELGQLLLSLAALMVLFVFGSRARTDRRWRWAVRAANAYALGLTLVLFVALISVLPVNNNDVYFAGGPVSADPPQNIYAFGPDGKPLSEVYLYDQDGRPIFVWAASCRLGPDDGQTNRVPQPIVERTENGECVERVEPPFTVAIPRSGTPSATSSAPPSAPQSAPQSAPPSSAPPTK